MNLSDQKIARIQSEFKQLGLHMVGMAKVVGDTNVFIKRPGWNDPMIYSQGDQINGYRIVSIQAGYTVFERDGVHIWLAIGGEDHAKANEPELADADAGSDTGDAEHLEMDESEPGMDVSQVAAVNHKRRDASLKTGGSESTISDDLEMKQADAALKTRYIAGTRQSGTLIAPIDGKVTSGFGYRQHPMGGGRRYHRGVDIPAKTGTPIRAAGSGRVVEAARDWAKGLNMTLDHGDGVTTHYFHMSQQKAKAGQWVKQGEVIGYVGTTGMSTGPHLHMEVHKNGQPMDPKVFITELANR